MGEEQSKFIRQMKLVGKLVGNNAKIYVPGMIFGAVTTIVFNWNKIKNV